MRKIEIERSIQNLIGKFLRWDSVKLCDSSCFMIDGFSDEYSAEQLAGLKQVMIENDHICFPDEPYVARFLISVIDRCLEEHSHKKGTD